ncbi:MAG TPA: UbiA family prenyltransferase [Lacipirellulaceae bacterium]|jgi:4-hydroxybenzoate polyprenyltransferase
MNRWRSYFELLRLPAVFTAMADVLMGYLVTHGDLRPFSHSGFLVAASAMLYLAGMALNDYFDADLDAIERPQRPIPSGRLTLRAAGTLGWVLLFGGVLLALFVASVTGEAAPFCVAVSLACCIYFYDALHKKLPGGPILMGFCRSLNVLLGMSLTTAAGSMTTPYFWTYPQIALAVGIGTYIVGVTIFARTEAGQSSRRQLSAGIAIMVAGIALLGFGATHVGNESHYRWIVWLVIAAYVVLRHGVALATPNPRAVQRSVRHALRMLIFLDSVVAFEAAPHSSGSLFILLLYVPMLILEYWFSTT